jgi:hypothetical protein
VIGATHVIGAQAPHSDVSGQNVQPVFEGWEPKKDGTFDLVFGYLNRNLGEDVSIPVGRENSIEPSGPDRGQPTFLRRPPGVSSALTFPGFR